MGWGSCEIVHFVRLFVVTSDFFLFLSYYFLMNARHLPTVLISSAVGIFNFSACRFVEPVKKELPQFLNQKTFLSIHLLTIHPLCLCTLIGLSDNRKLGHATFIVYYLVKSCNRMRGAAFWTKKCHLSACAVFDRVVLSSME